MKAVAFLGLAAVPAPWAWAVILAAVLASGPAKLARDDLKQVHNFFRVARMFLKWKNHPQMIILFLTICFYLFLYINRMIG
jgi:hypothetical protein